jgi:hypothetical protein
MNDYLFGLRNVAKVIMLIEGSCGGFYAPRLSFEKIHRRLLI